ncbi:MiaB-like tRNA modifying enzyme YliG [Rivularia sp. IAM M-261]|nr:MiaB-like tRNA modifying enzyme YliG [Calothrix sp. PCC 7716]GJD16155.1 MiaB-like tRNA modifying enzyme YliG [Rivularia sp. IAM M-261]
MLGLLVEAGYGVDSNEELADYVIVNTCSFIEAARAESVRTLVELAEANKKIVITGCMAQHFQEQLLEELPEAVAVVGTGDYHKIVDVIERASSGERVKEVSAEPTYIADELTPRYRTTTEGVAYLRVAEGCDYRCAFCIIPHLRGNQRSRTIESIVTEAEQLASQGVREIILISQITTNYGMDIYGKPKLAELLRALGKVDVPWIRMHYAYPTGLTPDVIAAIQETPNVLPYLDLPLQHSHPDVLRAMNRPWQGRVNDAIIERIKEALPNAVLRTTFIVGFPGETDEQFEHLLQFVQRHKFDHVGVFTFSAEEGTPAQNLPNQVPQEIMDTRRDALMALQQPISENKNQQLINQVVDVLIEQENPKTGELIGRSSRFAPEVDGLVYVSGQASLGSIVQVEITGADAYDLYGQVVRQLVAIS